MSTKYEIAGIPFRTKREIEQHVRGILAQTSVGDTLGSDDHRFMIVLLQGHRHVTQKTGVGIRSIRVELNTHWKPWKMFVIVRVDDTTTDFSYRACIYPTSKKQDFVEACRQAVVLDILRFKRGYFGNQHRVHCSVTNQRISWDEAHVDHDSPWPFWRIVKAYIEERAIQPDDVALNGDGDGEFQHSFCEPSMAEHFRRFHFTKARLRVISKEANLRLGKGRTSQKTIKIPKTRSHS